MHDETMPTAQKRGYAKLFRRIADLRCVFVDGGTDGRWERAESASGRAQGGGRLYEPASQKRA